MSENDTPRAEQVMPGGFRPIQWPHVVDLDAQISTDDEPMIVAQGDLRATAEALGSMELLLAILRRSIPGGSPTAEELGRIEGMARFWKQHVRLIGGLGLALLMAVAVLAVAPAAPAAAAEGPQPDPVAAVSVTLTPGAVAFTVPATTSTTNRRGRHCAAVFLATPGLSTGPAILGQACARSSSFTVPVTVGSRALPVGTSTLAVVDALSTDRVPQFVTLTARRPSKFGIGTWIPMPQGQLYISAGLYAYTPARAAWTPQLSSPVQVQEWSVKRGRWVVRATLTTDSYGIAVGVVYLGGGAHTVRVARPQGATVTATTGTARTFVLPAVVPIGVN